MRTCPQSIVAQQERYDWGVRLWTCLHVFPFVAGFGWLITCMLDTSLSRGLKLFPWFVILVSMVTARPLNAWGRAARCRKASNLLARNIVRYEVVQSMSDADLAEVAEQAARIMLAPLPIFGSQASRS